VVIILYVIVCSSDSLIASSSGSYTVCNSVFYFLISLYLYGRRQRVC